MALSILYLGTYNAFAQPLEKNFNQSIDLINLSTDSFNPVVSDFVSQLLPYTPLSCSHEWWYIGSVYQPPFVPKEDGCYAIKEDRFKCKKCGEIQAFIFDPNPVKAYNHSNSYVDMGHSSGNTHQFSENCTRCGYRKIRIITCYGPPCTVLPYSVVPSLY